MIVASTSVPLPVPNHKEKVDANTGCMGRSRADLVIPPHQLPAKAKTFSPDRDDDLIEVPLVIRLWSVFANTMSKIAAKAIDPEANGFPADEYATLSKKIVHLGRAQCKSVIPSRPRRQQSHVENETPSGGKGAG